MAVAPVTPSDALEYLKTKGVFDQLRQLLVAELEKCGKISDLKARTRRILEQSEFATELRKSNAKPSQRVVLDKLRSEVERSRITQDISKAISDLLKGQNGLTSAIQDKVSSAVAEILEKGLPPKPSIKTNGSSSETNISKAIVPRFPAPLLGSSSLTDELLPIFPAAPPPAKKPQQNTTHNKGGGGVKDRPAPLKVPVQSKAVSKVGAPASALAPGDNNSPRVPPLAPSPRDQDNSGGPSSEGPLVKVSTDNKAEDVFSKGRSVEGGSPHPPQYAADTTSGPSPTGQSSSDALDILSGTAAAAELAIVTTTEDSWTGREGGDALVVREEEEEENEYAGESVPVDASDKEQSSEQRGKHARLDGKPKSKRRKKRKADEEKDVPKVDATPPEEESSDRVLKQKRKRSRPAKFDSSDGMDGDGSDADAGESDLTKKHRRKKGSKGRKYDSEVDEEASVAEARSSKRKAKSRRTEEEPLLSKESPKDKDGEQENKETSSPQASLEKKIPIGKLFSDTESDRDFKAPSSTQAAKGGSGKKQKKGHRRKKKVEVLASWMKDEDDESEDNEAAAIAAIRRRKRSGSVKEEEQVASPGADEGRIGERSSERVARRRSRQVS
eukprot:CAMPEP_0184643240 /NCGR_PEP_ID=MMETSP0308-20130426/49_1 /TAXON_ID=38269 /ORGANISM="Gloeochaete witrockiana, Strain SAG 46.84" /LENGTH=613 /DNA_ID=CAMNT_0027071025 /DNA_START=642 /DNA_END=2483 /DNA_ORIENTATION=+